MLKHELGSNDLFISGTVPETSKKAMKSLKALIEDDESKSSELTNVIGFYTSCELGLAFTQMNLIQMIVRYRSFRNSVMIVYDVNKAQYGLNPIACYRLSP